MHYFSVLKALHIIFIVTWFAGLFYIIRIFIYHSETQELSSPKKEILQEQYRLMSWRLWYIITWPSAIITLILASLLLISPLGESYLKMPWMHVKLALVGFLYLYHILSHQIFKQLQNNEIKYSSSQLRIWNEVSTLLLFSVVFLVVLKSTLDATIGVIGIFSLMIFLSFGIGIYKKLRKK